MNARVETSSNAAKALSPALAQQLELARTLESLRRVQEEMRAKQNTELSQLQEENSQLKQLLSECEQKLSRAGASLAEIDLDARMECEILKKELKDQKALVEQLKQTPSPAPSKKTGPIRTLDELELFEAELNDQSRLLDIERQSIQQERDRVQKMQKDLDQAIRESEGHQAKERAELSRERLRLDKLREEIALDLERAQRVGPRENMAPVHKLREEMQQRRIASK